MRSLVPGIVAVVSFSAFLPALQNDFVSWDDHRNLVENPNYRGLEWKHLSWMFTTYHMGHYQPFSWITFGLDYVLWGMDPFGYHLTNLLLHSVNAALFYVLAMRLLSAGQSAGLSKREVPLRLAAGFAALVFAVHPLRVESVAWATERRDVLSGVFFLLTILCYLKAAERSGDAGAFKNRWFFFSLTCYGLSLLSKASAITLPIVLLVLDVYPLRRLGHERGEWLGASVRGVWLEKIPFFFLAGVFGIVALFAQHETGALKPLEEYGASLRIAQAFFGIAFYLWKTLVPVSLSPLYPLPVGVDGFAGLFIVSAVVVVGITVGLFALRRRWPAGAATWIYYITVLAPILGITQSGPQLVADRYTYLSCLGWAVLAGGAQFYCGRRWSKWYGAGGAPALAALSGLIVVVLAGLTWKQTQIWRNTDRLWQYTVAVVPESSIANYNFANTLRKHGNLEGAIHHYREALRITPAYARAHNNLALALETRGDLGKAVEHYQLALSVDPDLAEAHHNLGSVLARRGELDRAVIHFRKAVRAQPEFVDAHRSLSRALALKGKRDEAIAHMERALEILRSRAREGS